MDPRDRDAISDLFRKLHDVERQAGPRDAEAERLIADESQRLSGAPYYMAQTIIMQDMALNAKQKEVDDLKRQLSEAAQRPASSGGSEGGFLSRMFGSGSPQPSQSPPPQRGPWGAPAPTQGPYPQPQGQYGPPQGGQYAAPPPYPQQAYPQQGYAPQGGGFGRGMGGGGGGFLAGAAQTAMGVAGGVVLGNAIGSMFGGHHGGLFGGGEPTEVVNETTNIYEDNRTNDVQQASDDGGNWGNDPGQDDGGYQDASYDDGGFDDSGSDDTI